ncbi:MAG: hypothetical protein RLZZ142_40 [Verrucomicrobiota bacterium]|jgi:glycosyltransferase involved in cell wall biosynthesis
MRDVVFVSLEDWDEVWRRNQFLCAEWLRRFPGMRILFVGRPKDYSRALRRWEWEPLRRPLLKHSTEFPGLSVLCPRKWAPNSNWVGRWFNERSLRRQVHWAMRGLAMRNPILWINDHFAGHLAGRLDERAVVYDITDDWVQMPSTPAALRARIAEADRSLCRRADLVVVCSRALEASRAGGVRRLERVPNAVDAAHYASAAGARRRFPGKAISASGAEESPVFGYLGTLHGDRLDIPLLETLARARPGWRFVLCGPDHLEREERLRLEVLRNLEIRRPVPYAEVPGVLAEFDVCMVPHRCNAFTESLNPIKLWEYFACGRPIASTPVAGFVDYPQWVHLGGGAQGFERACCEALEEPVDAAGERLGVARQHSWQERVAHLHEIFRQEGWVPPGERGRQESVRRPAWEEAMGPDDGVEALPQAEGCPG